jgi:FkbM family methyltransferase
VRSSGPPLSWAALPILRGSLRGNRWLLATRSNFLLGTYEPEQTREFERLVRFGSVVYDIGAHFGYYTLLASRLVGSAGRVFAFEPSPGNLGFLRRHLDLNAIQNVEVLELALANREGTAKFDAAGGSGVGHLAESGSLEVQVTTLDAISSRLAPPNVLKIDVEGAEFDLLRGARTTLDKYRPTIFLALHSDELKTQCFAELKGMGYTFQELGPYDVIATPS